MFINWKTGARLTLVAILAACSADPNAIATTAPMLQPPAAAQALHIGPMPIGTLTTMRPLTRRAPLPYDLTASANIGPAGGTLRLDGEIYCGVGADHAIGETLVPDPAAAEALARRLLVEAPESVRRLFAA